MRKRLNLIERVLALKTSEYNLAHFLKSMLTVRVYISYNKILYKSNRVIIPCKYVHFFPAQKFGAKYTAFKAT